MDSFDGKTVIVTGAGSGIGRASALAFARRRSALVVADIHDENGASLAREITDGGGKALFCHTDVTKPDDCANLVRQAVSRFGRLDAALNNAGVADHQAGRRTADEPVDVWQRAIEINLSSIFYCLKAEIPAMLEKGVGAIVNMASVAGIISFANSPAYVASKHGIIGLTKAVCNEYAADGIRCNAIAPGITKTPSFVETMAAAPGLQAQIESTIPQGRVATPEEIAEAAVWLCSPAASFVNGACLPVDGGYIVR